EVLFNEPDFWQHPRTFERLRAGDCEDFAIWAWRKLVDLGYDAELIAGYTVKKGSLGGRHVWIRFRRDGDEFLFEPVSESKNDIVRRFSEVRGKYLPEFGVGRDGKRFAFG